jgi:HlyD family secretion protein
VSRTARAGIDQRNANRDGASLSRRLPLAIGVLAALALAAFLVVRWYRGPEAPAVRVQTADLVQTVVVSGRVLSPARVEIGSVITARVLEVLVEEGARVEAGQVLVRLDGAELAAAVAQARAAEASADARLAQWQEVSRPTSAQSVRQAEANLGVAEAEARRNRELLQRGFVGQARVDETERQVTVARAQLESARTLEASNRSTGSEAKAALARVAEARTARQLAEAKLAHATLRAPSAGVIVLRAVEPGDVVQPAKRLLSLAVAGETRISAQVDEKNLSLIRVGQPAVASADAFPGTRFRAEVITLAPAVDPQKGTVEAKLRVPEPPAFLRADMTVSVEIEVARRAGALVVPRVALRAANEGRGQVLVVAGERTELRAVRLGAIAGGRAEVLEGVANGDIVIVAPAVAAGQRVRPAIVAPESLPEGGARSGDGQGPAMGGISGQR